MNDDTAHEQNPSSVPARLKALRDRAGLSVREMAHKLGWPVTTYSTYEGRFKKPYLPVDKARQIADVLSYYRISASEVLELAGIMRGDDACANVTFNKSANLVPIDYVATIVSAIVELSREWGDLNSEQIGNISALFCKWYEEEVIMGRQPQNLSIENAKSIMRLLRRSRDNYQPADKITQ